MKKTKDEAQEEIVQALVRCKGRAYLDIDTGFGKTVSAIKFIKYVLSLRPNWTSTIVVPTIDLKKQWEEALSYNKITNYNVVVINGVVQRNEPFNSHITIIDEGHLFLKAKTFSRIFQLANGHYLVAMSGTWSEDDKKIVGSFLPCAYTITTKDSLENGWRAESVEYNLGLQLSHEDREEYNEINKIVDEYFSYFGGSFESSMQCLTKAGATKYVTDHYIKYPGYSTEQVASEYAKKANIWQEYTMRRTMFIQKHISKIHAAKQILDLLPDRKAITFGALQESSEQLTSLMPYSKVFHSKLETTNVPIKLIERYGFKVKKGAVDVSPLSSANYRKYLVEAFKGDEFRVLNTVKAVDLGLDVKGVNCAIIYGRNSKAEKNYQRLSRATRVEGDKIALIVNIYIKDTQDQRWLKSCQKGKRGIKEVSSVEELVNDFKKRLKD